MRAYRRLLLGYAEACVEYEKNRWKYWSPPKWIPLVVQPLTEKLLRFFPGYIAQVLGPFGLGSKVSIHFHRADLREQYLAITDHSTRSLISDEMWSHCRSITFSPRHVWNSVPHVCIGLNLAWVDESIDTKSYRPGTIGYLNGFNNPETLIPRDVSLNWFKERIR
jgi:hypothetical protein